MHSKIVAGIIIFLLVACRSGTRHQPSALNVYPTEEVNPAFQRISSITLPAGFTRTINATGSFGEWLRSVGLKQDKKVYLYDGTEKANQAAQFAVLDVSVGNQNLQQCADAVMRLRAEYLYAQKQFNKISFTDNDDGIYQFEAPFTAARLSGYLNRVFGMCGTASLSKQLVPLKMQHMQPGDVFIKGGFPGHAVIVMDMAEHLNGKKIYLLAQSYMPAQDIHVLNNPTDEVISPWYSLNDNNVIITPEYRFTSNQLKTWW